MERKRRLRVFVSASAQDTAARDELMLHLTSLERQGRIHAWHAGWIRPGSNARTDAEAELERADVVLVLLSKHYLAGTAIETTPGRIEREKEKRPALRVVPVPLAPCTWKNDAFLAELAPLPASGDPVSKHDNPDDAWNEIAEALSAMTSAAPPAGAPSLPPTIALHGLPHGGEHFLGREAECRILDDAWARAGRTRLVSIIAMGGAGKTTLALRWLKRLAGDPDRAPRRIFGYSFYSQGTSDHHTASTDSFFATALAFFGEPNPPTGPFERADRLATLVRQERALLLLDGLEPLQYPPGPNEGCLKDNVLASFLEQLAVQNPGLVVLTSREKLTDLAGDEGEGARTIELKALSEEAGAKLLAELGVKGEPDEMHAAVRSFKGHAFALTLLGNLLVEQCDGDVRRHREIPAVLDADARGAQARRMMAAYDKRLGAPEKAIVRLLGFFDRPAPGGALAALRAEPAEAGLNDGLAGMGGPEWKRSIDRLRKAGLVERAEGETVDAHPLVREYFGEVLQGENGAAWVEGHRRLYAWYAGTAKERPNTVAEMEPLYAAVMHGCRTGLYQEAFNEVFAKRIRRFNEHYSTKKLGAFGTDLSALAGFFEELWTRPVTALREDDRSFVLNAAGFALRALGRLPEAVAPMRAGLGMDITAKDWKQAAIQAINLSELHLTLGQMPEAIETARQSVKLADRSGDALVRRVSRTALADALHQTGQPDEAARLFIEAERMQNETQPTFPLLYSLPGYRYCDLLLSRGEAEAMLQRAEQTIQIVRDNNRLLDVGLGHLSLARAHLSLHANAPQTRTHFDEAVARLREAGQQDYFTHGLIHRAAFHRQLHEFAAATGDLDQALRLATRGHMRLHEADAHLERVRLFLDQGNREEARRELGVAKEMIEAMKYGRRKVEIKELLKRCQGSTSGKPSRLPLVLGVGAVLLLGLMIAALVGKSPHTNSPSDMAHPNQSDLSPPPPVTVKFRSNQSKVRIRLPNAPAPLCETLPCEVPWAPGQPLKVIAERNGYPPQTITLPNPEQAMRNGGVDVYFGVPAPSLPGSPP